MKKKYNASTLNPAQCYCESGLELTYCCGRFLSGENQPETAEQLMRSRYTAFVLKREDYLLQSWHSSSRPISLGLDQETNKRWLGLKILTRKNGQADDDCGTVEFVARYKEAGGKAVRLREISLFKRESGQWKYVGESP